MEKGRCANVGWSIGNYCNARCNHCYSWATRIKSEDVLSKREVDIIIDKLIDYKVETVNFGGNEPIFTNGKDVKSTMLPYIIRRLSAANIKCGITTNGFSAIFLYENNLEEFMLVNDWDFSLDAPCREEHDKNRNTKGLFEQVIKAIKICKANDRQCSIVIAGMKSNLSKKALDGFVELTKKYNTEMRINLLKPTRPEHFEMFPSAQQVYEAFDYLSKKMDVVSVSEPAIITQYGGSSNGCPCGSSSFRIRSKINGRVPVTPCVYLDLDAGDILTESIDDIVNSSVFTEFLSRKKEIPNKCKEMNCDLMNDCRGGCSARTLLVTRNANDVDPYCPYKWNYNLKEKPAFAETDCEHVRVHENYLCTWIGKPKI